MIITIEDICRTSVEQDIKNLVRLEDATGKCRQGTQEITYPGSDPAAALRMRPRPHYCRRSPRSEKSLDMLQAIICTI